jgi:hypothetical protein
MSGASPAEHSPEGLRQPLAACARIDRDEASAMDAKTASTFSRGG